MEMTPRSNLLFKTGGRNVLVGRALAHLRLLCCRMSRLQSSSQFHTVHCDEVDTFHARIWTIHEPTSAASVNKSVRARKKGVQRKGGGGHLNQISTPYCMSVLKLCVT